MNESKMRILAKNNNVKALEYLRNREIIKKYLNKIEKIKTQFPGIDKKQDTITKVFHYGKLMAYSEFLLNLNLINTNILETLEN